MEKGTTSKIMITLKANDGEEFIVPELVAIQAKTIRLMIEDDLTQDVIPLPNMRSKTLAKVIEYCKRLADAADASKASEEGGSTSWASPNVSDEMQKTWEKQFIDVDQETLFDLMMAANFLDMKELLVLTCQKVADMIKKKNVEEIRQIFGIKNDFTPEEEEDMYLKYEWAFN
jgi:S-phase kinase-associated protein 1